MAISKTSASKMTFTGLSKDDPSNIRVLRTVIASDVLAIQKRVIAKMPAAAGADIADAIKTAYSAKLGRDVKVLRAKLQAFGGNIDEIEKFMGSHSDVEMQMHICNVVTSILDDVPAEVLKNTKALEAELA